eukprot:c25822_g1_i2 orf=236-484(+)
MGSLKLSNLPNLNASIYNILVSYEQIVFSDISRFPDSVSHMKYEVQNSVNIYHDSPVSIFSFHPIWNTKEMNNVIDCHIILI